MIRRAIAAHGHLMWALSVHDFRYQYVDSLLGVLWSMIKPFVLIAVYVFVFSTIIAPTTTLDGQPVNFGLYLFAGMLPWIAIQDSVQRSATVFTDQASLIRHHRIPLFIFPFSIVLSSTISALFIVAMYIIIKGILAGGVSFHALFLVVLIPIQVAFCCGLSLVVSTLNVVVRDISHAAATFMTVLFFTSPVIFPAESISHVVRQLMWLNPLTGFTYAYRDLLLLGRTPSIQAVIAVVCFTVLAVSAGFFLHARMYREIVDRA